MLFGDEHAVDGVAFGVFFCSAYLKFNVKQRCYWPIITTSVIIDHCHFNKQLSTF